MLTCLLTIIGAWNTTQEKHVYMRAAVHKDWEGDTVWRKSFGHQAYYPIVDLDTGELHGVGRSGLHISKE